MDKLNALLNEIMDESLKMLTISRPRNKGGVSKYKYRPVIIKDELVFQETGYIDTKVIHKNLNVNEAKSKIMTLMENDFVQLDIDAMSMSGVCLVNRKGEVNIKVKKRQSKDVVKINLSHNKEKRYILKEGVAVPFLVDLGVMTKDGKIVKSKYDKYRQINRFLEFVEDILEELPKDREVRILDFGCGKSYLTFAMYYYLKVLKGYDIRVTGLDLKEDVINKCNDLRDKYKYDKLEFLCGDISTYDKDSKVDMVVTLHACDTATDYALYKAVKWDASVILSVPCCQHELNKQIDSDMLNPVLKYGLIKERMSALLTDGIRAELLKSSGYEVQVLEFIDMEHTPKNILIRATKTCKKSKDLLTPELDKLIKELKATPKLLELLSLD